MQLPTPKQLKELLPITPSQTSFIEDTRATIGRILQGEEKRFAIVAGPCSIHDKAAALEYAQRFKALAESVEKSCFLVMRVYAEKPRTTTGWKGYLYDPHLDGSYDITAGLVATRELFLELTTIGVPVATEFVDPLAALYFSDLVSWGFIGARTSASQTHRQLASSLPFPIGFKNGTDGNTDHAIQGALTAHQSHAFLCLDEEGKISSKRSRGNPHTHVVLRGSTEGTNYAPEAVDGVLKKMHQNRLGSRILVDCSHGNCQKQHEKQKDPYYSILEQIDRGNDRIAGVMLESHLQAGSQSLQHPLQYAVSVTDPCLDWETTENLILEADLLFSESGRVESAQSV